MTFALLGCSLLGSTVAHAASSFFSPTGSMGTTRTQAAAAPLPDGRVLVMGGFEGSSNLASAEAFDPATNSFSSAGIGPMGTPRQQPAAAPLPDGRVLVAGGFDGSSELATAEIFDPDTGSFSSAGIGTMATPRIGAIAAPLPGGRVLIAGGSIGFARLTSAEIFDPATNSFSSAGVGPMGTGRHLAAAAPLPDGRVLVAGGNEDPSGSDLDTAEIFDPASSSFSSAGIGAMTTPRYGPVAAPLPDGRVLVAGSFDSATDETAELFDPASGTFSSAGIGPMNRGRWAASAASLADGRVLVAGGSVGNDTAEIFNPPPMLVGSGADFGARTVGTPSPVLHAIVRNLGGQRLNVLSSNLGGANPTDYAIVDDDCAGASLANRESCWIGVRFTAFATGARPASIEIASTAPGSPHVLPLGGTGVAPATAPTASAPVPTSDRTGLRAAALKRCWKKASKRDWKKKKRKRCFRKARRLPS